MTPGITKFTILTLGITKLTKMTLGIMFIGMMKHTTMPLRITTLGRTTQSIISILRFII